MFCIMEVSACALSASYSLGAAETVVSGAALAGAFCVGAGVAVGALLK